MTDAPVTVAGALRQYLVANIPDTAIYRNTAPADTAPPVIVIIDPVDTISSDLGDDLILLEQVQVDLYIPEHDATGLADITHSVLNRAPISIPGSQIHDVRVSGRRADTNRDSGITRIMYTVDVKRRITPGDNLTPLPFPVRPDLLTAHENATVGIHGIADTALLETKTGAQEKADSALQAATEYVDAAVEGFQLPEDVETATGAQAKADAALAAANIAAAAQADQALQESKAYTDTAVANIDLPTNIETVEGAQAKADTAVATAAGYTDNAIAAAVGDIDFTSYETHDQAQTKADAAVATAATYTDNAQTAAQTYTDLTIQDVLSYADSAYLAKAQKGAVNGVASLGTDGKVPNSQLPPLAITETHVVATQAAMLALSAEIGDVAVRSDLSKSFILKAAPASTDGNWQELLTPPNAVVSVDGRTGAVSLGDLYDPAGTATTAQTAAATYTDNAFTNHVSAVDPHGDRAYTTGQISAHTSAADPHGDRAYADGKFITGTDTRLTDTRTPTDGSVTSAKIVSGAITGTKLALGAVSNATIASDAAIALSKLGQTSATQGQVPVWNGSAWAPGYPEAAGIAATLPSFAASTSTNWLVSSSTNYVRVQTGATISKMGMFFATNGAALPNMTLHVYRNTGTGTAARPGTLIASTATRAVTSAFANSYQEFTLPSAVTVYPGDWFAVTVDGSIAISSVGVATSALILNNLPIAFRHNVFPAPSTPTGLVVNTNAIIPLIIGVP